LEKEDPCYTVAEILAGFLSYSVWKVKLGNHEIRHLAKEISKQCFEEIALCLLAAYGNMQEERSQCRKERLNKKWPGLKIWEILSLPILQIRMFSHMNDWKDLLYDSWIPAGISIESENWDGERSVKEPLSNAVIYIGSPQTIWEYLSAETLQLGI
jgi:hypothetical protein